MSDEAVSVAITANPSGLISGFKTAREAVNAATEKMSEGLRDFKSESVSASRAASFFAVSLSEIVPGADAATESIRNLVAAGMEGLTLGAAIELAVVASRNLQEMLEASENQAKTLKAAYVDTFTSASNAMLGVQKGLARPQTAGAEAWDAQVDKAKENIGELHEKMDELETSFTPFRTFFSTISGGLIQSTSDQVYQLQLQISNLRKGLNDNKPVRDQTEQIERLKYISATDTQIESMEASLSDRITQINAAKNEKLHALQGKSIADIAEFHKLETAINATAATEISRVREDARKRENDRLRELAVQNSTEDIKVQTAAAIKAEDLRIQARRTKDPELRALLREEADTEEAFARQTADRILRARLTAIDDEYAATLRKRQQADQEVLASFTATESKMATLQQANGDKRLAGEFERIQKEGDERAATLNMAEEKGLITHDQFLAKLKQNETDTTKELGAAWEKTYDGMISSGASAITSVITGTKTAAQAMKDLLLRAIEDSIAGLLRMGAQALATSLITKTSMVAGAAMTKAVNFSSTQGHIAAATAAAAESQAMIPFIGPELSIAAAATEMATLQAMTGPLFASARGGMDRVPYDGMFAVLHKDEQVLSKPVADYHREAAQSMGGPGGGGDTHNWNIYANDAQSFEQYLGRADVQRGISNLVRTGRWRG